MCARQCCKCFKHTNSFKFHINPRRMLLLLFFRFHKLRAWSSIRLPALQIPATNSVVPKLPVILTNGLRFGGSHYPLRCDNFLDLLTELRKALHLWYSFIIMDTNQDQPMKRCIMGAWDGPKCYISMSSGHVTFLAHGCMIIN